jgi:primosomal protein N' (replication factor Y) (superfamily II helicase)
VDAPLAAIRGWHRQRLLVKTAREADLQGGLRAWLDAAVLPRGCVKLHVDADPYSFL